MRPDFEHVMNAESPHKVGAFAHLDSASLPLENDVRNYCDRLLSGAALSESATKSFFRGKMLRTKLTSFVGKVLGSHQDAIVKVSASIELLHEASLAHDDIQDRQFVRRGQASLWRQVGVNQAINIGDLLQSLAYRPLLEIKSAEVSLMLKHLNDLVAQVILGQIKEQNSLGKFQTRADYEEIVLMKTGALIGAGPELLALHTGETLVFQKLRDAFWHLSFAFQFKNDLSDILSQENSLDLKNKVVALPLILLLEKLSIKSQHGLDGLLSLPTSRLIELMQQHAIDSTIRRLISSHLRLFRYQLQKINRQWKTAFDEIEAQLFETSELP